jgi:hypothetical protein
MKLGYFPGPNLAKKIRWMYSRGEFWGHVDFAAIYEYRAVIPTRSGPPGRFRAGASISRRPDPAIHLRPESLPTVARGSGLALRRPPASCWIHMWIRPRRRIRSGPQECCEQRISGEEPRLARNLLLKSMLRHVNELEETGPWGLAGCLLGQNQIALWHDTFWKHVRSNSAKHL